MVGRIPPVVVVYVVLCVLMLAWDVLLAGRIAQMRRVPRRFAMVSALGGLLVAPAAIIALAASSTLYGRALQPIAWVWPFTAILFLIQAVYATARRLVTPMFGVPIVLYDLVIAAVALSKYIALRGGTPPDVVLSLAAAQANALGLVFGPPALWRNFLQIPLLAPAIPAHWRVTAFARVVLGAIAMVATGFILVQVPDGLGAVRSYRTYADERLQERPEGDFALGVKILPSLSTPPMAHAFRSDTALVRMLGTDAIGVVVEAEGATAGVLDSLARGLDLLRTDTSVVVVALVPPRDAQAQIAASEERYIARRSREIDRITRWVRPTILVPVFEPYGAAVRSAGVQPPEFWQRYIAAASQSARRVRPATRIAYSVASYGLRDSAMYAWAASPRTPVHVIGLSLFPGFDGAATLDTRVRVAQRWIRQHGEEPKDHWVLAGGGFPGVHGERSQELAIWGIAAWATAQPAVKGMIVFEAGDYDAIRGLRTPEGRLRSAATAVQRAKRGLEEAAP